MAKIYHYPPELFALLVDTVPLLCRSKNDVVLFLRSSGVPDTDLAPVAEQLKANRESVNKYHIVRTVLEAINARGDSTLAARREVVKRVVEFENFSTCWPEDQLKAKGLVAEIRGVVNVKDSFTRMKQERDLEHAEIIAKDRAKKAAIIDKNTKIEAVRVKLDALFTMDDKPHARGKALEIVLNDLFRAYGILIREDFQRRDPDSSIVLEQIDGVISIDGKIHLVEMKWLNKPVGIAEFSPHLVRLFGRANAHGIFISTSDFTRPVLQECASALNQRTMFLCSLREIVMLLSRSGDLLEFLRKKSNAAIADKEPFLELLE